LNCRHHLYIYIPVRKPGETGYKSIQGGRPRFPVFPSNQNVVEHSEPPSIYMYTLMCHRRSFFPIRVYNHHRDCTGENPSGRATYVIVIPDDGTLCPLGVGRTRYEARGRRCRTNGWGVRVYFAKRARLTNRTNPPSHKSIPGSTIPVHSNRHLSSHPSQARVSLLSLYMYTLLLYLYNYYRGYYYYTYAVVVQSL